MLSNYSEITQVPSGCLSYYLFFRCSITNSDKVLPTRPMGMIIGSQYVLMAIPMLQCRKTLLTFMFNKQKSLKRKK